MSETDNKLDEISLSDVFVNGFRRMQTSVHNTAIEHGWYDNECGGTNDGEKLALMHCELSEALQALREGNPNDKHCPDFSSVEIELADTIIRIMDYAEHKGFNIAGAILSKASFNMTRPYKHGKKF